jgi:hypothetical protein
MQSKRIITTKKSKKKKKIAANTSANPDSNTVPIIRDGYSTSTTAR